MAGEITRKELHPELLEELLAGGGARTGTGKLIYEIIPVTTTAETTREVTIPKEDFILSKHNFEVRIGGIAIPQERYTIVENKIVLASGEGDFPVGRRLDFVFIYLERTDGIFPATGVRLVQETKSVTSTVDGQKEFDIPMVNFNKRIHNFELRLGSVVISDDRYKIVGSKLVFNADEAGVTLGRKLDFAFTYLKETEQNVMEQLLDTKPADVKIEGRTLVNLLGRAGNAIYKQTPNVVWQNELVYDGDKFKLTNTTDSELYSAINFAVTVKPSSYYVVVGHGCALQNKMLQIAGTSPDLNEANYRNWFESGSNTEKNLFYAFKTKSTLPTTTATFDCGVATAKDKYGYFRNIRCYEVSKEEFDAITENTEAQANILAEKYPYVDDVKCVVNPYFECKENLLEDISYTTGSFTEDGKPVQQDGGAYAINRTSIPVEPNTNYTLSIQGLPSDWNVFCQLKNWNNVEGTFSTGNEKLINVWAGKKGVSTNTDAKYALEMIQTRKWKIVLVKASTPKTYNECHNSRMMFETKVYNGEKITRDNSGRYVKNSEWGEVEFSPNGVLPNFVAHYSGFKGFTIAKEKIGNGNILLTTQDVSEPHEIISYNGGYYAHSVSFSASNGVPTMNFESVFDGSSGAWREVSFTLPNALTGWGNSYTPTQEEIRAFFLGWTMYGVTNSDGLYHDGGKGWAKLWCGIGEKATNHGIHVVGGSHTNILPTILNDQGYTPYRLIYKKATPTIEEVKVHGSLVVKDGVDVNVGSGLVLGEKHNELFYSKRRYFNGIVPPNAQTKANNRVDSILKVYNNNVEVPYALGTHMTEWETVCGKAHVNYAPEYENSLVDYLIYRPDVVTSFPHTFLTPTTTKEVLEKTIQELSNTNEKLSAENRELHHKIENLPQVSNPNLLINGDFQVWQRGGSFTAQLGTAYTSDRWGFASVSDTAPLIKKSMNGGYVVSFPSASNKNTRLQQYIENGHVVNGRSVTLSFCARSVDGASRKIGCSLAKGVDFNKSFAKGSFDLTGEFNTYSITAHIKNGELTYGEVLGVSFGFSTHIGNYHGLTSVYEAPRGEIEIEYIKLELGEHATPHVPRSYGEELALCQRYYQTHKKLMVRDIRNSSSHFWFIVPNVKDFRVKPTLITHNPIKVFAVETNALMSQMNFGISGLSDEKNIVVFAERTETVVKGAYIEMNEANSFMSLDAEIY